MSVKAQLGLQSWKIVSNIDVCAFSPGNLTFAAVAAGKHSFARLFIFALTLERGVCTEQVKGRQSESNKLQP